ncbi:hypothetical protein PSTT_09089 [Puccinia striiformis]|uniref:DNA 3'-5' helicase n=1 Tax=Puccinia striiformis TaxID=27350 RepID=A0A2S4V9K7_9BASI|nr:hypothetical protein PSTT_09089 [Puccinia striiformis]
MNDEELREAIIADASPCYPADQPPKPIQLDAAMGLVKQRNTSRRRSHRAIRHKSEEAHVQLKVAAEIKRGKYNLFDEAHLLYGWGMVKSGKAKKSSAHKRHGDRAVFCPSYGQICRQLMATQGIPILLLSATCRPQALEAIQKNLKIPDENIDIVRAELTRPEIRILRFSMKSSLKSVKDLTEMFGKKEDVKNEEVVPTLIYSGTRNATLEVMKVINAARGTPGGEYNPNSEVIRRYHAVTGDMEKEDVVEGYESGISPVFCVPWLWGSVRTGKRPGLAIMFVEPKRRFGLNTLAAIAKANKTTDDVRMDSLAITPVCLRIAFSVDNLYGYIPINCDDLNYLHEQNEK